MRKNWAISFVSFLGLFLVSVFLVSALFLGVFSIDYEGIAFLNIKWPFIINSLVTFLLIISLVIIYKKLIKKNILEVVFKKRTYILMFSGVLLCLAVVYIRNLLFGESVGRLSDLSAINGIELLKIILILWVPVLFEELLFRKYLVELGEGLGLGLVVSTILSAILFALAHSVYLENSWFLIIMAIFLSYTRYLFGGIAFAVGVHFAFNVIVYSFYIEVGESIIVGIASYDEVPQEWAFQVTWFIISCFATLLIAMDLIERSKQLLKLDKD